MKNMSRRKQLNPKPLLKSKYNLINSLLKFSMIRIQITPLTGDKFIANSSNFCVLPGGFSERQSTCDY